ncbi:MAG: hypothetical protein KKE64_00090, partial [Candidatus Omnitrophica bacterium]|nr:hypothetical protein [Candidatus Omnitrophota bacterium]
MSGNTGNSNMEKWGKGRSIFSIFNIGINKMDKIKTQDNSQQQEKEFKSSFKSWIRIVALVIVVIFVPEQVAQAAQYDWRVLWNKPVLSTFTPMLSPAPLRDIASLDIAVAVRNILKDVSGKPITSIKVSPTLTIELDKPLNISKKRIEELFEWLKGRPCGSKALYDYLKYKGQDIQEQDIAIMALTVDILNDIVKPEGNPSVIKTSMHALAKTAEFFGHKLYPVKVNLPLTTYPLSLNAPFVAHLTGDHYILVTRIAQDKVYYSDNHKEEFLPLDKFSQRFSGYALITKPENPQELVSELEAKKVMGASDDYGYDYDIPSTPTSYENSYDFFNPPAADVSYDYYIPPTPVTYDTSSYNNNYVDYHEFDSPYSGLNTQADVNNQLNYYQQQINNAEINSQAYNAYQQQYQTLANMEYSRYQAGMQDTIYNNIPTYADMPTSSFNTINNQILVPSPINYDNYVNDRKLEMQNKMSQIDPSAKIEFTKIGEFGQDGFKVSFQDGTRKYYDLQGSLDSMSKWTDTAVYTDIIGQGEKFGSYIGLDRSTNNWNVISNRIGDSITAYNPQGSFYINPQDIGILNVDNKPLGVERFPIAATLWNDVPMTQLDKSPLIDPTKSNYYLENKDSSWAINRDITGWFDQNYATVNPQLLSGILPNTVTIGGIDANANMKVGAWVLESNYNKHIDPIFYTHLDSRAGMYLGDTQLNNWNYQGAYYAAGNLMFGLENLGSFSDSDKFYNKFTAPSTGESAIPIYGINKGDLYVDQSKWGMDKGLWSFDIKGQTQQGLVFGSTLPENILRDYAKNGPINLGVQTYTFGNKDSLMTNYFSATNNIGINNIGIEDKFVDTRLQTYGLNSLNVNNVVQDGVHGRELRGLLGITDLATSEIKVNDRYAIDLTKIRFADEVKSSLFENKLGNTEFGKYSLSLSAQDNLKDINIAITGNVG